MKSHFKSMEPDETSYFINFKLIGTADAFDCDISMQNLGWKWTLFLDF